MYTRCFDVANQQSEKYLIKTTNIQMKIILVIIWLVVIPYYIIQ